MKKKTTKAKKKKTKALAIPKGKEIKLAPPGSIEGLMQTAIQTGAGIEQLQKLIDMKYKHEEREARKDYFQALSEFQAMVGPIPKSKDVSFDGQKVVYRYAPLDKIEDHIKEAMKTCGLSKRFDIQNIENKIKVTCVITHLNGHSEKTSMEAGADTSGSKNTIQSNGSTVTYLQRYTLVGALGLVTADEDNDGRTSEPKSPTAPPVRNVHPRPREEVTHGTIKKVDKETGVVTFESKPNPLQTQINALKRLFKKVNPKKTEDQLRSLWLDQIGDERKLTIKRIEDLGAELEKTSNKRKGAKK